MAYWTVAQLQPQRERLALYTLALAGYAVYFPRLRHRRRSHSRLVETRPPLFPGYSFLQINGQWSTARYAPGVADLIMDGMAPARVPDRVIDEIKARERGGLVELPRRPLEPGDRVRIMQGPLTGQVGLYAGMRPRERILVLLQLLGAQQRVTLAREDVEALDYKP
jgi:transcriptional antiterminator RfaH